MDDIVLLQKAEELANSFTDASTEKYILKRLIRRIKQLEASSCDEDELANDAI